MGGLKTKLTSILISVYSNVALMTKNTHKTYVGPARPGNCTTYHAFVFGAPILVREPSKMTSPQDLGVYEICHLAPGGGGFHRVTSLFISSFIYLVFQFLKLEGKSKRSVLAIASEVTRL